MSIFCQKIARGALIAVSIFAAAPFTWADSFTISSGETVTTTQTLDVDGETGLIESGGFLDPSAEVSRAIDIAASITTSVSITNNGAITTQLDAIRDRGTNTGVIVTVINNGTIATINDNSGADAINFPGSTASTLILINNGVITTSATTIGAEAVVMGGENNIVINNGTIATRGVTADTVTTSDDNFTITNNGAIISRGERAHAIFSINNGDAETITITNTGSVIAEGIDSNGIHINNSAIAVINNSGLIRAFDPTKEAILASTGVDTLNLLSGSQLIGIIDLRTGTDTVNILGANNSSTLTLANAENINLLNGNGIIVGDVATVVDPTGQSVSSAVLSSTTFAVHNVVNQHLAHHQPSKPIQVAASELSSGIVFQERAPQIWGSVLGEMRERDLEGIALGYDHNYVGFTGGYEVSFYKARIGLLGGFIRSTMETTGDKFGRVRSVDTDTNSLFAGAYSQYFLGGINLTTTLMAGYEDHENDRAVVDNLNGFETAQSDFLSFFISPSLTASSAYSISEQIELRPSVTLAYSGGWYENYAETGTTRSDLVVDGRNVHALTSQLQLAAAYSFFEEGHIEFRAGAKTRHTDNSKFDVSLAGANFQIPNASDNNVYGGYVGANLQFSIADRVNLVADIEHGRAGGGEEHIALMMKLEGRFN